MSAQKTTATAAIAPSLGITILLQVCCFVILSEAVITPINVPTQMHAHSSSNNRRIDDSANTIRTTYEVAYALKSKQDHNNNQNPHSVTTTTDEIGTCIGAKIVMITI